MFSLGKGSEKELVGVDKRLVSVVREAIMITKSDFTVHDGIRSEAEQRRYVAAGTSKTMNSKHLRGLAVDLVPWVDGKPRWWWPQIYQIAAAMLTAARNQNANIKWGVVWDTPMLMLATGITDLDKMAAALEQEGLRYNVRHPGKDFPDGPHYELLP